MRFLADENVEQPIVDALREAGHDVLCISHVGPGASDSDVFRLAATEARLILTNDKDFGELAYRERRVAAGVVLLRLESESGAEKARRLTAILPSLMDRLPGHFAVLTDHGVRLRPLSGTAEDTD